MQAGKAHEHAVEWSNFDRRETSRMYWPPLLRWSNLTNLERGQHQVDKSYQDLVFEERCVDVYGDARGMCLPDDLLEENLWGRGLGLGTWDEG